MLNQSGSGFSTLLDSRLKKAAFAAFILTNIGMVLVPAGLGALGVLLNWPSAKTVSTVGIGFAINEVILFTSIAILGKPLVKLIRKKITNFRR